MLYRTVIQWNKVIVINFMLLICLGKGKFSFVELTLLI